VAKIYDADHPAAEPEVRRQKNAVEVRSWTK
jgi:hypothetical protein